VSVAPARRGIAPRWLLVSALIALAAAGVLLLMGRVPICTCGYVKLWHGEVVSPETSQHLSDWYSPSHLIHGLLFYGVLHLLLPRRPLGLRLALATLVEVAWEIAENTDTVINRYREATIALGYDGDSVLNSLSDIGFMWLGFALASRLPVWASVLIALGFEVLTTALVRDGLALNVLMLVYPLDAVRQWQGGA